MVNQCRFPGIRGSCRGRRPYGGGRRLLARVGLSVNSAIGCPGGLDFANLRLLGRVFRQSCLSRDPHGHASLPGSAGAQVDGRRSAGLPSFLPSTPRQTKPREDLFMRTSGLLILVAALALAMPAAAALVPLHANLDGLQETPPNASPATGTATMTLDTTANTITMTLNFSGLLAPQTAAHIHGPGAPGVPAGILVPLPTGTFVNQVFPITDTIEGHILAGLTYINVHSTMFPAGEIRGQILMEPVAVDPT